MVCFQNTPISKPYVKVPLHTAPSVGWFQTPRYVGISHRLKWAFAFYLILLFPSIRLAPRFIFEEVLSWLFHNQGSLDFWNQGMKSSWFMKRMERFPRSILSFWIVRPLYSTEARQRSAITNGLSLRRFCLSRYSERGGPFSFLERESRKYSTPLEELRCFLQIPVRGLVVKTRGILPLHLWREYL